MSFHIKILIVHNINRLFKLKHDGKNTKKRKYMMCCAQQVIDR